MQTEIYHKKLRQTTRKGNIEKMVMVKPATTVRNGRRKGWKSTD